MKAVVAGSTGLVGLLLIQKIINDPRFTDVISVSRRPLKIQSSKLKQVLIADFSQIQNHLSDLKGDIYFCCLGTTIQDAGSKENFRKVDFDAIIEFGKAASANSAKSFILISAMGADPQSLIFYNRVKGETEKALKNLQLNSLTILRPGLLIGDRQKFRLGEKIAIDLFKVISPMLPEKVKNSMATEIENLADKMIHAGLEAKAGLHLILSTEI